MDSEFDDRLRASAPSTTPRSAELDGLLADLAHPTARRASWRKIGVTAALSLTLIAGATAATASPLVQGWLGWTPDRTITYQGVSHLCAKGIQITTSPGFVADPEAMAVARRTLDGIVLTKEIVRAAVERDRAAMTAHDPEDPALSRSAEEFEAASVGGYVFETISDAVRGAGYSTDGIALSGGTDCTGAVE